MADDLRPVTQTDFKDFKKEILDDLRRELMDFKAALRELQAGQVAMALSLANSRVEAVKEAAKTEKELLVARSKESDRITRIDMKTAALWAAGGAILLMAGTMIFNMIRAKP